MDAMLEAIQEAAGRGDNVRILGFGAFLVRKDRTPRHFCTHYKIL
ncbi:MAG TPA: hypothetical protein DD719_05255 [Desulfotomaculum sp.]|nr:hypothetical protein [Desulfotomaculum sp.]